MVRWLVTRARLVAARRAAQRCLRGAFRGRNRSGAMDPLRSARSRMAPGR